MTLASGKAIVKFFVDSKEGKPLIITVYTSVKLLFLKTSEETLIS